MSAQDTAYRTADPTVIETWNEYQTAAQAGADKRLALSEQYGRNLWVNRIGFGHGTKVVGFERFDSDKDGDLLADGALIVSTKRGSNGGLIVPNLRRKSGKEFEKHLTEYRSPALDLPGMPTFQMYGDETGLRIGAPALWLWEDVLYAFWPCVAEPVSDVWENIPLSIYYTALEQKEQADAATQEG